MSANKYMYNALLTENVTKTYKHATNSADNEINSEAKVIAERLEIDDRVNVLAKSEAFITLKDHKENFEKKLPCRLINPAKPQLGVASKEILESVTEPLRSHVNLWKNTHAVIDWFNGIQNPRECSFVVFDIVEFYPSISEELLKSALEHASSNALTRKSNVDIMMHARKSLLFAGVRAWMKKDKDEIFDVTMGSHDGAEACELVGAFILSKLVPIFGKENVGLYRDDGLAILRKANGHRADRVRKDVIEAFRKLGLRITIDTNMKAVNFLDITMNIATGIYKPYRKPNDTPLYVNTKSNHPPSVIKSIPVGVNKRLVSISCTKEVLEQARPLFADALRASGHASELSFPDEDQPAPAAGSRPKKRNRDRRVIWFNPPYSASVATGIGARFLSLIQKHFPKGSKMHKLFNRNTVKISYSCMPNMARLIKAHNKRVLHPPTPDKDCNCRIKNSCPLEGKCQADNVIYQAMVSDDTRNAKVYTGMSAPPFKARYSYHLTTLRHDRYENSTELSKHVWSMKRDNRHYVIDWKIRDRATSFDNTCICMWPLHYREVSHPRNRRPH
ncbi:uncharacterized protein LOC135821526 [Sycon ciliatum]|uniref:uncharacterized protein LOC135821526 n=1 Tax=Sycon ciliatum TaxID=27933 RepID=UPI0031F71ACF